MMILLVLGASGCGRKETPSCDATGAHVEELFGGAADPYAVELRTVFRARCMADHWPDEMRSCIATTKSLVEPQSCKQKLTPEQVKTLEADLAAVDERAAMSVIPGACTRYEKMLASVLTCAELPASAREQLRTNFDSFKASWPEVADRRTLESICATAIQTVKAAASTCPGAETW